MTRPVDPIAGKTADPACGWCHGRGWSIAADRPEIERCDACAVFVDDEHAGRHAARWVREFQEARSALVIARAQADGAASLLLDVQRDCIEAVNARATSRAALAAAEATIGHLRAREAQLGVVSREREKEATAADGARLAAEESAREARCEASALRTIIRRAIDRLEGAERVDGKRIRAERRGDA